MEVAELKQMKLCRRGAGAKHASNSQTAEGLKTDKVIAGPGRKPTGFNPAQQSFSLTTL